LNFADIIFIIILLTGAYLGYKKGLFQEILTFFALIIALVIAFKLIDTGIKLVRASLEVKSVLLPYIAFVLIFFVVFVLIILLGKTLENVFQKTLLGSFDKAAGAILGMVKYAFCISTLLWLTFVAGFKIGNNLMEGSFLYPYLLHFAPNAFEIISHIIPFQNIFSSIHSILKS
jgi:membrane protein required for colicin V production